MKTSILRKLNLAIMPAVMLIAVVAVLPLTVSADSGKSAAAMAAKPGTSTIVGIVLLNDGEFDVLQAAVVKAGLVETLNGTAQYTVFAPTDAAFVKTLNVADEAAAIKAVSTMDKAKLTNILLYHVTNGRHTSTSVLARSSYPMLNGQRLTQAQLVKAGIAATDVSASNGVIHVINSVLLPQ